MKSIQSLLMVVLLLATVFAWCRDNKPREETTGTQPIADNPTGKRQGLKLVGATETTECQVDEATASTEAASISRFLSRECPLDLSFGPPGLRWLASRLNATLALRAAVASERDLRNWSAEWAFLGRSSVSANTLSCRDKAVILALGPRVNTALDELEVGCCTVRGHSLVVHVQVRHRDVHSIHNISYYPLARVPVGPLEQGRYHVCVYWDYLGANEQHAIVQRCDFSVLNRQ